jgi:prepilin-type N-terminal cleavage/methylation domain-containing protein
MGKHFTRGFTIIETMLVLAITGVLIAGLLVGVGSSVGIQRYRDAVTTLKSQLQDQYSEVMNVSNDRDADWTCDTSAVPAQSNGGIAPGQSDCVLLGRYIAIVGSDITTATVVGYIPPGTTESGTSDVSALKNSYTLGISTSSITTSTLEWGAQIAWPQTGTGSRRPTTPRSIAILIVRSPTSGTSYTFTDNTVNEIGSVSALTLKNMLIESTTVTPGRAAQTICIDPGVIGIPEPLAIYIAQAASGPGSIESRSFETIKQLGGDSKC